MVHLSAFYWDIFLEVKFVASIQGLAPEANKFHQLKIIQKALRTILRFDWRVRQMATCSKDWKQFKITRF